MTVAFTARDKHGRDEFYQTTKAVFTTSGSV
jgi:hypothetical protein